MCYSGTGRALLTPYSCWQMLCACATSAFTDLSFQAVLHSLNSAVRALNRLYNSSADRTDSWNYLTTSHSIFFDRYNVATLHMGKQRHVSAGCACMHRARN
jgi:hypothetical protein